MKKVAVIGLGIMGHGVADNFIENGYTTYIWNRSKDKAVDLVKKGAILIDTPKDAAKEADVIFEVTANDQSSKEVWLGKDGILEGCSGSSGKIGITCATLSTNWIDKLAKKTKETKNLVFFDMPMTGGRTGAESGTLTLLIGGDKKELDKLKGLLHAIAKENLRYFGKVGSGMRYKLILNGLQATHVAGFGEAMRQAKALGLDAEIVGNALSDRPGGVPTVQANKDYQEDPDPIHFSVEWIKKDLDYLLAATKQLDNPIVIEVYKQYENAIKKGFSKSDWSKINKLED